MPMIRIKPGVSIASLQPQMAVLLQIAQGVYSSHGLDCVVTSGDEGEHGLGSLHFVGLAVDLRTRDLPKLEQDEVRVELQEAAGKGYDVVLESNHIHCEYQPKKGTNQ